MTVMLSVADSATRDVMIARQKLAPVAIANTWKMRPEVVLELQQLVH